jgi:hypothetical protein
MEMSSTTSAKRLAQLKAKKSSGESGGASSLAHSLSFPGVKSSRAPSLKQLINPNKFTSVSSGKPTQQANPASGGARIGGISRTEKSLTALTTKFMKLLQESQNGILDLRNVTILL